MNRRDFLRAGLKSAFLVAAVTAGLGRASIEPERKGIAWVGNFEVIDITPRRTIEATQYQWREYGQAISVKIEPGSRQYGKVTLPSGRRAYRNYGRELKNGKGLSFVDLLQEKIERRAQELRSDLCGISSYMTGAKDGVSSKIQNNG